MTSLIAQGVALDQRLAPTDLRVERGELVALVGPNGGGKTSLLRALARTERAAGTVVIDGEALDTLGEARRRRLLAFLPASREVHWPIAARDVIALGLEQRDAPRVAELIALFELGPLADRPIDRLSTGERARVLMARALAARPRVLLLDEPLSNLDPYWVLRMLDLLYEAAMLGQVVIVALHDLALLDRFDRALLIANGKVELDTTPAALLADARFEQAFRVRPDDGRFVLSPSAGRRSSR